MYRNWYFKKKSRYKIEIHRIVFAKIYLRVEKYNGTGIALFKKKW
jgi:hypothetical protein